MRRTLAMAGAAALAIAGLAGPAVASSFSPQDDVVFTDVQPDTSSPHTDAYFDLATSTGIEESLDGSTVVGCVGANNTPVVFVEEYASTDVIPASDFLRTTPPSYTGPSHTPTVVWDASSGALNSDAYVLRLVVDFEGPNEDVIDSASNNAGSVSGTCLASLPPA